jgi:5-methylthioadenosine/S-adenosylhomocysteine deaminase
VTSRILLEGGCVLTLGAKTANFLRADVLVEDGVVAEVGPGLRARDAERIDATEAIVMPGFVDTHRHAWRSLFRNLGDDAPNGENAAAPCVSHDHLGPEDVYAATLLGLLGAVEAGITTLVDWADLRPEDDAYDAALQAHADAGLRTVFVPAPGPEGRDDEPVTATTRRLAARRRDGAAGGTTEIGFGSAVGDSADLDRVVGRWAQGRELGLRIHAHLDPAGRERGVVSRVAGRGVLGDDVTVVHSSRLDESDVAAIASSGASVSLAPSSEMAGGLGSPPIQSLIDQDIRPGLGVDDARLAPGDLFAQMRATISLQHATVFERKLAGKAALPRLMSTRDVIRHATIDGARAVGLGAITGSLEPGKKADVIVLRTDRPNVFPVNDPIGAVVWGMDTSNVDWVLVGGRVLMRGGVLQADVRRVQGLATAALHRVASAAGLLAGAAPRGDE